ncbi:hypothetical protein EV182_007259, partial [Spiromyces aspiralis]
MELTSIPGPRPLAVPVGGNKAAPRWRSSIRLAAWLTFIIALIVALAQLPINPRNRNHCLDTITKGWWLRSEKHLWQPSGCTLHQYTPKDISKCYDSTQYALFIGDSNTRAKFYTFAAAIDPDFVSPGKAHSDIPVYRKDGSLAAYFIWDQYLISDKTNAVMSAEVPLVLGTHTLYRRPSLLVLGTGAWYLAYKDMSGGLTKWRQTVDSLADLIAKDASLHQIADAIYLSPMYPIDELATDARYRGKISPKEIDWVNSHLTSFSPYINIPTAWISMAKSSVNQTIDGLHYSDLVETQAMNIIYNHRCNDK